MQQSTQQQARALDLTRVTVVSEYLGGENPDWRTLDCTLAELDTIGRTWANKPGTLQATLYIPGVIEPRVYVHRTLGGN